MKSSRFWVVYYSEIVNGNKRVRVIISAKRGIICACSISCGVLKRVYRYKNRKSVFIRVNQWLTKVFSHRLTQITLISSICLFPGSFILYVMVNYRRLGHSPNSPPHPTSVAMLHHLRLHHHIYRHIRSRPDVLKRYDIRIPSLKEEKRVVFHEYRARHGCKSDQKRQYK